jgi:single-stranded-DNA-specific exonuclease
MTTRGRKRWRIAQGDARLARELADAVGATAIVGQVLANRGITDRADARAFLQPDLNQLHDPSMFPEMEAAARRIRKAVDDNERIAIYGDFDVDGITATCILMRCLRFLGAEAAVHIPNRLEEGYGINSAAVRQLAADGVKLLVTVDCGITAAPEAALARELGMEVIVTDHHEPGSLAPSDCILVNPKLPGCSYPFRDLSGAGLAFKLAWAIGQSFANGGRVEPRFREFLVDSLSLAALGTIADVVPLHGENRVIAAFGLRALAASRAVGIKALCDVASVGGGNITAFDVAFKLAPRLNAAGRLGSALEAVEMLATDDPARAAEIAQRLNSENSRRQKVQERMLAEAVEMVEASGGVEDRPCIVLAKEGWHAGVVGIVASRLVETYWRPVVLLVLEGDVAHGSGRSIDEFHLHEALTACSRHLVKYGGHARAAGLRLQRENLQGFTDSFFDVAAAALRPEELAPTIEIDAELELSAVNRALAEELARLAPFGEGNREPLFMARNVEVHSEVRRMGTSGRHLSFWVKQGDASFRATAFGQGDLAEELERVRRCAIAFVPRVNIWRGKMSVEVDVRDIQFD